MASIVNQELLAAAATITASETTIGTIAVGHVSDLTIYLKYVKGDETSVAVSLYFVDQAGNEYQWGDWTTAAGAKTFTVNTVTMAATANRPVELDVSAITSVVIKRDATGGSPTGTLAVYYDAKAFD